MSERKERNRVLLCVCVCLFLFFFLAVNVNAFRFCLLRGRLHIDVSLFAFIFELLVWASDREHLVREAMSLLAACHLPYAFIIVYFISFCALSSSPFSLYYKPHRHAHANSHTCTCECSFIQLFCMPQLNFSISIWQRRKV